MKFGIITAKRKSPTINRSIKSLRETGYGEVINIYAEPHELNIEDKGVNIKVNKEVLGCFRNFDNALKDLIKGGSEFICVLSDDVVYTRMLIKKIRLEDNSYSALYTPRGMARHRLKRGWNTFNKGWANAWGGLYMMHRDTAIKIVNHEFYINHLENYEANQQIDHCIPEVCFQLGINQYYHVPSLTDHIGIHSTIGHTHTQNEKGYMFQK